MNEWSPNEFYSGSMKTDQQSPKAYRQYWEDNQTRSNTMNVNNKKKDYQNPVHPTGQTYNEDVGIPPSPTTKRKKVGASDPRFKRVINPDTRRSKIHDQGNTEKNEIETKKIDEFKHTEEKIISILRAPKESSCVKKLKTAEEQYIQEKHFSSKDQYQYEKPTPIQDQYLQDRQLVEMVTKDVGLEPVVKAILASEHPSDNFFEGSVFESLADKTKNSNSNIVRSASDCTLLTRNTCGDENDDDNLQKIKPYPSTTRIKVHKWMKDNKLPPEKRRSVITVIGQTQNKPFSKILNEINQRRKLAKELDKHALCKAIMESTEHPPDVKNLVAKLDFILPDGKIIYSTEKVYSCNEVDKYDTSKESDDGFTRCLESLEPNVEKLRKRYEMIPERDSSLSQVEKRNKTKKTSKKLGEQIQQKLNFEGKIKKFHLNSIIIALWPTVVVLLLLLCVYASYYYKQPNTYYFTDFIRPKNKVWYKKFLL